MDRIQEVRDRLRCLTKDEIARCIVNISENLDMQTSDEEFQEWVLNEIHK